MKNSLKRVLCLILAFFLCLAAMPTISMQSEAATYYSESDLGNIRCTILSNSTRASYVNDMMKYHIMSSTDNYRVARNLKNGSNVVFFFDGCSDNMDNATYSNYNKYHLSAYCAVVKEVNGVPKIVYENENSSTIPDNPRNVSLNSGSAVPTVLDGVYNIVTTNHLSRYASFRIADNSGTVPVIRCSSSSSYISTSGAINIHARSNFASAPTNGVSSSSYSSTGCFLVGLTNNTWSEYNSFIYATQGISNAVKTTPYSSGSWTKCSEGYDKGVVIVDRANYKTQLKAIYGGDNSYTASSLVSKITAYTDNIGYTGHTTHTYTGSYYEAAHPHRVYQQCSCGATKYTGATTTVSTCDTCNPVTVSNKYAAVLPFKGYLVGTSIVYPCSTAHLTSETGGEIWSTDECTITEVYTNGACKVTYPTSSGTKTAYTSLSNFVGNTSASLTPQVASHKVDTYIRASSDSTVYGYAGEGDTVYKLGTSGNMTQIFYPLAVGGYKIAWAITSELASTVEDIRFDPYCPIKGYPCATANFEVQESDYTTYAGKIFTSDYCTINAVYSDGWCQVTYPATDGNKTAYTPLSNFVYDTSFVHEKYTATQKTTVYKTKSLGTDPGWYFEGGDVFYVVSTYGDVSQILYPIDEQYGGGYKLGWISTLSLPQTTYAVIYEGNGGFGVPDTQYKTHGSAITLSSVVPTRDGYEFVGWATDKQPNEVIYQPGDNYSVDSNVTLIAIWKDAINPVIEVGSLSGKQGTSISVPIRIIDNPGIIAARLKITYNTDALTLTDVTDCGILGECKFSESLSADPYIVSWSNGTAQTDYTISGELIYLTFRISEDADLGDVQINVSYDSEDIFNKEFENISFAVKQGTITVEEAEELDSNIGDINEDGSITVADVVELKKMLLGALIIDDSNVPMCDVTGDGVVDLLDILRMKRYLADRSVQFGKK